jgi:hypothetical protein
VRFASDARLAFGLLASSVLALGAFVVVGFGPLPSRALRSPSSDPPTPAPQAGTEFVDITDQVGLADFRHMLKDGARSIADAVAPGLALLDLDQDDDLDLVLLGGASEARPSISIYLNRLAESGQLGFEDVTAKAGITWSGVATQGICAGDVDLDGDVDLFVTAIGGNMLFLNQLRETGELTFVEATDDALPRGGRWHWVPNPNGSGPPITKPGPFDASPGPTGEKPPGGDVQEFSTGATFGDFDADGDLDLFVSNYVSAFEQRYQTGAADSDRPDEPTQFQPLTFEGQSDRFYLNDLDDDGELRFTNVTQAVGANDRNGRGMGAVFMLVDSDIYPDIYIANDKSENLFLHNVAGSSPDGETVFKRRFEDLTALYGLDDPNSGMGIAHGDADGDADLDLLTTNWRNESASLFLFSRITSLAPDGTTRVDPIFTQRTNAAGLKQATARFVGWGCVFFDYDNDGDEDLFIGNGFTSPREDALHCAPERPLLFQNDGAGHFADVTGSAGAALAKSYSARGVVAGDLDRDGDLDLVIAQNYDKVVVLENRLHNGNHSLSIAIRLGERRGDAVNVQVTATVGPRQLVQELTSGGSYLSQNPFEVHFGLGRATRADQVRITWPTVATPPELFSQVPAGHQRIERVTP